MKTIQLPLTQADVQTLRAGDAVRLHGRMLTGRDAAHKRLCALLDAGEPLPVDIAGQCIYYVGPCPAKEGWAIGSCGPTTSGRMDSYAPRLIRAGLRGMIGKGPRNAAVVQAMRECGAVYFAATGGAGALLAARVKERRVLAFDDLGTEAIHQLLVEDFPVVVAIDAHGGNLYQDGPNQWKAHA